MKSWTQYGEEKFIKQWFSGHVGRLLDVGAYNGCHSSNTIDLIELGWHAVLVEPSPMTYAALVDNYNRLGFSDRCLLVNAAICGNDLATSTQTFYDFVDQTQLQGSHCGSMHLPWVLRRAREKGITDPSELYSIDVQVIAAGDFIAQHGGGYDFINIDAEGLGYDIANSMPWDSMTTSLVCLEIDQPRDKVVSMMSGHGFAWVEQIGHNLLFGRAHLLPS